MAKKPEAAEDVIPISRFRRSSNPLVAGVPQVDMRPFSQPRTVPTPSGSSQPASLTGPTVWMLLGPGGSGKTTEARWLVWRMAERGGDAVLAALDPGRRALVSWFGMHAVEQPVTKDTAGGVRHLNHLLDGIVEEKVSAIVDFGGGGEVALQRIVQDTKLLETLEAAGVNAVAAYLLTPRIDDLDVLLQLESLGFQPKATVLFLNTGRIPDLSIPPEEAFAPITSHSIFRDAVARGAVPIWLPTLEFEVMAEIEAKRLHFGQARDGVVPDGATFPPIGGLNRSRVGRWLERMEDAHRPIWSWLPS
jgi:hypothetical protein